PTASCSKPFASIIGAGGLAGVAPSGTAVASETQPHQPSDFHHIARLPALLSCRLRRQGRHFDHLKRPVAALPGLAKPDDVRRLLYEVEGHDLAGIRRVGD